MRTFYADEAALMHPTVEEQDTFVDSLLVTGTHQDVENPVLDVSYDTGCVDETYEDWAERNYLTRRDARKPVLAAVKHIQETKDRLKKDRADRWTARRRDNEFFTQVHLARGARYIERVRKHRATAEMYASEVGDMKRPIVIVDGAAKDAARWYARAHLDQHCPMLLCVSYMTDLCSNRQAAVLLLNEAVHHLRFRELTE
jgi:hypothetical protein